MDVKLFDYQLPEELIAQHPADRRDNSRMLVMERDSGKCVIRPFSDIVEYLSAGDLMVCNNTRVVPCRLYGRKEGRADGAEFEILLLEKLDNCNRSHLALLRPGKRALPGVKIVLVDKEGRLNGENEYFEVAARRDDAFELNYCGRDFDRMLKKYGHMPLPPYIKRRDGDEDERNYQTVFAANPGAVAAPTAGLHFSGEVLEDLAAKGVERREVTLHVGIGTFRPVSEKEVEKHKMHSERFVLPPETASAINRTREAGKKVLAVGTTTIRTLESCVDAGGRVHAGQGRTEIFLYPPYRIKSVDMLLTNFHLPQSTLLMLVSCFADREKVLAAYELAKKERMRFFSYGDCMLLI